MFVAHSHHVYIFLIIRVSGYDIKRQVFYGYVSRIPIPAVRGVWL